MIPSLRAEVWVLRARGLVSPWLGIQTSPSPYERGLCFFEEGRDWWGQLKYEFAIRESPIPFRAPVLLSGKAGESNRRQPFSEWQCRQVLEERWLPKSTLVRETRLGLYRRIALVTGSALKCTMLWEKKYDPDTYEYFSASWDAEKADKTKWPEELVSAIEDDLPLTFRIAGPCLAKVLKACPQLAEHT